LQNKGTGKTNVSHELGERGIGDYYINGRAKEGRSNKPQRGEIGG
jgi:hypothetical protein